MSLSDWFDIFEDYRDNNKHSFWSAVWLKLSNLFNKRNNNMEDRIKKLKTQAGEVAKTLGHNLNPFVDFQIHKNCAQATCRNCSAKVTIDANPPRRGDNGITMGGEGLRVKCKNRA